VYTTIKLERISDIITREDSHSFNGMKFSSMEIIYKSKLLVYRSIILAASEQNRHSVIENWAKVIWCRSRLAKSLSKIRRNNNNNSGSSGESDGASDDEEFENEELYDFRGSVRYTHSM
jgi:hypothetical protein